MKPVTLFKKYFGKKNETQTLKEFAAEVKALSDEDTKELALLVADELGVEADLSALKL